MHVPEVTGEDGDGVGTARDILEEENSGEMEMGRGKRVKIPSTRLRDCVTHTIRRNKVSSSSRPMASFS